MTSSHTPSTVRTWLVETVRESEPIDFNPDAAVGDGLVTRIEARLDGPWSIEPGDRLVDLAPVLEALRYIAGYDVAGYEPHMLSDEVAQSLLATLTPSKEAQ